MTTRVAGPTFRLISFSPPGPTGSGSKGKRERRTGGYDLEIVINRVLNLQPDSLTGKKPVSLRGDGVYNATAAGQSFSTVSKKLKKVTLHGRIDNDGDAPDTITMGGTRKTKYFKLQYFDGSGNATAAMYAGNS